MSKTWTAIIFLIVNTGCNLLFGYNEEEDWKILFYQMLAITAFSITLHLQEKYS